MSFVMNTFKIQCMNLNFSNLLSQNLLKFIGDNLGGGGDLKYLLFKKSKENTSFSIIITNTNLLLLKITFELWTLTHYVHVQLYH